MPLHNMSIKSNKLLPRRNRKKNSSFCARNIQIIQFFQQKKHCKVLSCFLKLLRLQAKLKLDLPWSIWCDNEDNSWMYESNWSYFLELSHLYVLVQALSKKGRFLTVTKWWKCQSNVSCEYIFISTKETW